MELAARHILINEEKILLNCAKFIMLCGTQFFFHISKIDKMRKSFKFTRKSHFCFQEIRYCIFFSKFLKSVSWIFSESGFRGKLRQCRMRFAILEVLWSKHIRKLVFNIIIIVPSKFPRISYLFPKYEVLESEHWVCMKTWLFHFWK